MEQSRREFVKQAASIGAPVIIQSVLSSMVNMLNVFMIGQLGEVAITSAAMGNQWFQLFMLLINGITAAGSIFIAQYWGRKDTRSIHQYMGILLYSTLALAIIFMSVSLIMPKTIIGFYSRDAAVIKEGSAYIQIISVTYIMCALNGTLVASLRSVGRTKLPMIATAFSLLISFIMNYSLILGKFGFPQLGVQGAAIAIVIARVVEISITAGYTFIKKPPILGKLKNYLIIESKVIRKYITYGSFVILGEVAYAIGNNLYNVAYKYTGTESQAALQIVSTFQSLSLVFCGGLGTAAAVMLGTLLGRNQFEEAKKCCKRLLILSVIISVAVSFILILFSSKLQGLFHISLTAQGYISIMIRILACAIPLRMLVFLIIVGILRSGGDSVYCFFANLIGVWCIGIPLVFMAVMYFKWPIYIVYIMATAEELGKFLICFPRVIKYKWIQNLT